MNAPSAPIRYREFWDVPRIFLVPYSGTWYLFDCEFDEETEDYPEWYEVYVMPELGEEELAGSWEDLSQRATHRLGPVRIDEVHFDPTRRSAIDATIIERLRARVGAA